ncbi:hypothetical protein MTR67_010493 [Solanum verrucosum]|uniref:Uncharacterized protein n=1 Tax=Solanum verrucosum TaxID=315347 RepID=A0AAF0TID9_SOLVR|nr:hypothetical protein MTR67_010493 [Solanum verrucosum]
MLSNFLGALGLFLILSQLIMSITHTTDASFFMPNVKRKLVNIWNSKLEAQGGNAQLNFPSACFKFAPTKTRSFLDSGIKWWDFPRDYS